MSSRGHRGDDQAVAQKSLAILDQYHDATEDRSFGTRARHDLGLPRRGSRGQWQAKELMDHLESVLATSRWIFGHNHVEIKLTGFQSDPGGDVPRRKLAGSPQAESEAHPRQG